MIEKQYKERIHIIIDNWNSGKFPEISKLNFSNLGMLKIYVDELKETEASEYAYRTVKYYYAKGCNSGRLYAYKGASMQGISRSIRHTLMHDIYNDIDIKNAHATILEQYCEMNNINHKFLSLHNKNPEKYLKKLMDAHNIDRDRAKEYRSAMLYGGRHLKDKTIIYGEGCEKYIDWFEALAEECKEIRNKICKLHPEYAEKAKEQKKENPKLSAVSLIIDEIENNLLMSCIKYLQSKKISTTNLILCFDGFMILKEIFNPTDDILNDLSEFVYNDTKYKVKYVCKPYDMNINLDGLKRKEEESILIDSDITAANYVINELNNSNNRIYLCQDNVYIKDINDIWTKNSNIVDREIINIAVKMNLMTEAKGKKHIFSKNLSGLRRIIELVRKLCPIDDEFIETVRIKSKGKIFFKDCLYDFSQKKYRLDTDDDMTTIRINRNRPNEKPTEAAINNVYRVLNSIFQKTPTENKLSSIAKNYIQHIARGLAGDLEDKAWVIGHGLRNCGKGILTTILNAAFGDYVVEINANNFIGNKHKIKGADEAKNNMWLMNCLFKRIYIANEAQTEISGEKSTIDGSMIKTIASGGDYIGARQLYENAIKFKCEGRLFMFLNQIPEISQKDVLQTLSIFRFPCEYLPEDEYDEKKNSGELYKYEKKRDNNLKSKVIERDFIDAFIYIVLSNYEDTPVIDISELKNELKDLKIDMGDDKLFFKENFEVTPNTEDKMAADEVLSIVHDVLPDISGQQIKSFLTANMGAKYISKFDNGPNKGKRGFQFLRLKKQINQIIT